MWAFGGSGVYKYFSDAGQTTTTTTIRGTIATADLLAGYGFEGDNYSINVFVGPSIEKDRLSMPDALNSVQGTQIGAKGRVDWYVNPTPQTLWDGEAEYSTAFQTYFVKAKAGYDPLMGGKMFIGPEIIFLGNERYDQWRLGAHVTTYGIGKVNIELSGGYVHDNDLGTGGYGLVEFNVKF